jgi:TolA-binding protein/TM2 domain-containing membrane protein YozV
MLLKQLNHDRTSMLLVRFRHIMFVNCRVLLCALGMSFLFLLTPPLQALPPSARPLLAPPQEWTATNLLTFADHLMREKEYFRAITEYQRFLFYYPHDHRSAMALFRIGLAFYRGQDYSRALDTFRQVTQRYPETPYGRQAWLWQGESLMQQAKYSTAERIYSTIIRQEADATITQFAHYQRGWSLLYRRQWQEASAAFRLVNQESPFYSAAQRLALETEQGAQLPKKSPALAGMLSALLPGSGQLYNGRPGDALLSFLLNGIFILGTLQAVEQDELAIAGVLGFFEVGWYTGNVYSAVNGAHKYNRHAEVTFLGTLEDRFRLQPPEARRPSPLEIHVGFRY